MAWVVLLISSVLEAVWATALGESEGFSRPIPSVIFVIALALSMVGLGYARRVDVQVQSQIFDQTVNITLGGWRVVTGVDPDHGNIRGVLSQKMQQDDRTGPKICCQNRPFCHRQGLQNGRF